MKESPTFRGVLQISDKYLPQENKYSLSDDAQLSPTLSNRKETAFFG